MVLEARKENMENSILKQFETDKQRLLFICQAIESLENGGNDSEKLNEIRQNVGQEKFRLVILGQFKRGKSTFINALLGERVLPTDVIPVTTVITELIYDSGKFVEVLYADGREEAYSLSKLDHFVSESENPHNQKKVDRVIVHHPAPILARGVILVDTPGVGSIHHHNTRLTQEYIPNADAGIFLFSGDPPLTELEQAFLKILLPIVPKVFFVLNKKDYLTAAALSKVLKFNASVLKQLNGADSHIFPISALQALNARIEGNQEDYQDSGVETFENELKAFLVQQKGRFLLLANAERLERIVLEKKNLIEMSQKAHTLSVDQLLHNLREFKNFMDTIRRQRERLFFLLSGIRAKLLKRFDQETKQFIGPHAQQIRTDVNDYLQKKAHAEKKLQIRQCEQFINDAIVDYFEPFRMRTEKELKAIYQEEIQAINRETLNIINEVYEYSAELFQTREIARLPEDVWQFGSQFYYKTWETVTTLDLLETDLIALLPRSLFLRLLRHKAEKWVHQKLERQSGRLRADILYQTEESNRQFMYEFDRTLERIQQQITTLIQQQVNLKEAGEKKLSRVLQEQDQKLKSIEKILQDIRAIVQSWKDETLASR